MVARKSFLKSKKNHPSISVKGFTLVELIIVILLVGILAAIAVPRYIEQANQARTNSITSLAAALAAASANNFAQRSANSSQGQTVDNCTDIAALLPGGLPTTSSGSYSIASQAITANATATCTLNLIKDSTTLATATFTGMGIS